METVVKPFIRPLLLALTGVVCAWALVRWVYTPYHCIREIAAIGNTTLAADRTGAGARAAALARENLRRARALEKPCRTCVTLYPVIAANELILGRDKDAIATWRRALTIARRPELHFAIGVIHLQHGRVDEAMDEFLIGGRFNPQIVEPLESPDLARELEARLAADRLSVR